jgi:hypothetical protein
MPEQIVARPGPLAAILIRYFIGQRPNACLAQFYGARANVVDLLFAEPPTAAEWSAVAELVAGRDAVATWFDSPEAHRRTLARLLADADQERRAV